MEDKHDVQESDNVADSNWKAERHEASLLDHEDHQDWQVGGGQYFDFLEMWNIQKDIWKCVLKQETYFVVVDILPIL